MTRSAFTLLEVLLVMGMLSVVAGISAPTYRDYRIRSDLRIAADQVSQVLERARLLAQAGHAGSPWGFSVPHATLFAGTGYAERDPAWDEYYILPAGVRTSGLEEVSFSPLEGIPGATGSIVLTSLRNERAMVSVLVDRQGITVLIEDRLTICHCEADPPHTLRIAESAWPAHRDHGDHFGPCKAPDPWAGCNR